MKDEGFTVQWPKPRNLAQMKLQELQDLDLRRGKDEDIKTWTITWKRERKIASWSLKAKDRGLRAWIGILGLGQKTRDKDKGFRTKTGNSGQELRLQQGSRPRSRSQEQEWKLVWRMNTMEQGWRFQDNNKGFRVGQPGPWEQEKALQGWKLGFGYRDSGIQVSDL